MKRTLRNIRALVFDVFGTVVDWRGTISREIRSIARTKGVSVDPNEFAVAWRAEYQPAMNRVRTGALRWTRIDELHRMNLDAVLPRFGLDALNEVERRDLNLVWHRLRPWPDAVRGLRSLKANYLISTLSNGNVALLTNMAKHARLPWDCILSAETFKHYKPDPEAYLGAADALGLEPGQVMMVAAHKSDLDAAAACGLRTAFVPRPLEYGDLSRAQLKYETRFDLNARDFNHLAEQLER